MESGLWRPETTCFESLLLTTGRDKKAKRKDRKRRRAEINESCNIRIWFRGIYNRLVLLEVLELLEILELLKVIKVLKVIEVLKMPKKLLITEETNTSSNTRIW